MRILGRHRGKHHCSLLSLAPITFDANTPSCYGGSYFATIAVLFVICRSPLNLVGPSMPTSSSLLLTSDHCLLFRVCFVAELSSALIIYRPLRALQLSTPTLPSSFFRVTSHEHGACPPRLDTLVYCFFSHTRLSEGRDTGSFFLQRIAPKGPTIAFPYNNIRSRRNIDGFRLYVCS
jgi:hypothetical protein